ncbi:MAG: hypothetical protein HY811_08280 [Planctomycetes bacterium]|nr:hypothetical protein [Planctomycetota bacterium]
MDTAIKEIQIVMIDKDKIEKNDSFSNAYSYPFKLTSTPDAVWVEQFVKTYDTVEDPKKRKMYVADDYIMLIMAADDNKQKHIDIVKCLVFETNSRYKKICREKQDREAKQQQDKDNQLLNLKDETAKFNI